MTRLLHLDSSARRESFSRTLTSRFAEGWRKANPDADYTYRDLAADPVPPIGEAWTRICDDLLRRQITDPVRYAEVIAGHEEAWSIVEPLLAELLACDVLLIGAPMYNYSIPAALKAWLDQVTFPRMDLSGRRIIVASGRGGSYLPGTPRAPFDYHERYLRDFFAGHWAITDVTFVHSELTNSLVDPVIEELRDKQSASHAAALAEIDRLLV